MLKMLTQPFALEWWTGWVSPILIIIPIIVISSAFISYFCEDLLFYLRHEYDNKSNTLFGSGYFVFLVTSFMARTIAAYFIIQAIYKRFKLYSFEENNQNTGLRYSQFSSKYHGTKLLALSVTIMGFPSFFIVVPMYFFFNLRELGLALPSFSLLTVIGISLDIVRMTILTILFPRFKITITKLYYALAVISGLSGLLYILFAKQIDYDIINSLIISPLLVNFVVGGGHYHIDLSFGISSLKNTIILPVFTLYGFILIGITQIVWALKIRRKRSIVWHFFGVAGAVALTLSLTVGMIITSTIVKNLEDSRAFKTLHDELYSILLALNPITIAIVSLQFSYIILTAIILTKEKQIEMSLGEIKTFPTKGYLYKIIRTLRQKILVTISLALIVSILVSSFFAGSLLSHGIMVMIDSAIPTSIKETITSLTVNPATNSVYALVHSPSQLLQPDQVIVINGTTNRAEKEIDLDGFARDIAVNPITNMNLSERVNNIENNVGENNRVLIQRKESECCLIG